MPEKMRSIYIEILDMNHTGRIGSGDLTHSVIATIVRYLRVCKDEKYIEILDMNHTGRIGSGDNDLRHSAIARITDRVELIFIGRSSSFSTQYTANRE